MQYLDQSGQAIRDTGFSQKVKEASGANIDRCYYCLTCSLDCPVAFAMDYRPDQLVRLIQLGLRQKVLTSSTIWLCANCEACAARCPNDVAIIKLMDALREMALRERTVAKEKDITAFHHTFLANIKRWGRQYELSLLLQLKLRTRDFFSDLGLGIKLLRRGKLKLLPPRIKNMTGVREMFQRIERSPEEGEQT